MENASLPTGRIKLLDTMRGFVMVLMIIFHIEYDLVFIFGAPWLAQSYYRQMDVSWMLTASFVLLAGITVRFSKDAAKHGAKLLFIGAGFTMVTAFVFPGNGIYWGVLHLIGTGMLLYGLFSKALDRLPWWLGLPVSALLFTLTFNTSRGYLGFEGFSLPLPEALTVNDLLYAFGFVRGSFSSVDYLPVLPWIFMFLCGVYLGKLIMSREAPEYALRDWCPPLTWLGRNSLIIYIVHQPIAFVLLYIIYIFIPGH